MIRVLIVDDHPLFRTGAVTALAAEPDFEIVGEAATAAEAMETVRNLQPDLVLTDIRLKGGTNSIDLAQWIRAGYPDIRILVLTNYSNEPYVKAMMEIGVEGYMLKDTPPRDVIDSVRMIMDGRTVFSRQVTQTMIRAYANLSAAEGVASPEKITEREAEVLQLLVRGASNTEIAERLHVVVGTVQYHLTNIYGKLGVRSRAEAIIHAARTGLVVIDE